MAGPLIWTASIGESQWHGVMRWEWSGTRPVAVCGHVVRGKVHGRRSVEPPEDERRSTCRGCLSALFVRFGALPQPSATSSAGKHRAEDTDRTLNLARVLDLFPAWPLVDRDIDASDRRLLAA